MTKSFLRAALMSTAILGMAGAAQAAGTAPGVSVTNSIDLSYTSSGNTISRPDAASVSFVVDRKVDFIFEGQDSPSMVAVEQGASEVWLTFRLQNEGNDSSAYDIDLTRTGALGLTYDATGSGAEGTYSVYVGPSANPGDAADVLYDVAGVVSLGDLAADDIVYVKIRANIPDSAVNGQSDQFDVVATALDAGTSTPTVEVTGQGLSAVDTIFADTNTDGVEADAAGFQVQAPDLSASKTVVVISENLDGTFDCATGSPDPSAEAAVPGACLEYTISVTNGAGASAAADSLQVSDILPADLTFEGIASNTGFDTVVESGGTITADKLSLPIGDTATFTFRASVN